jgi:putative ABC transport system permease protein
MMPKLIFGTVITLAAIAALLLILIIVGGIVAGLLAPLIGSVPVSYNFRSIRARWTSTIVAILGIAGTVGVFVAMLSLARGFRATLVASGSPDDALVMRAGSTTEMMGGITLDSVKLVQDKPGVARDASGQPLVTQEVVGVIPVPLITTGTDANVEVRGVAPNVLEIRKFVKVVQGRMFHSGLDELVVGKNASKTYQGLTVGNTVAFGGGEWKVVGVFDAGGSSFDSEVWCDARILPAAFDKFKDSITSDPQLNLEVEREVDYYAKQSSAMTQLITVLGGLVAAIMAIGAVFGALNTMYSAVAERGREIATMRALGFSSMSVILSFLFEALLISFIAGIIGCLAVLPLNGMTTQTMNFSTFSNIAFAFKITFSLLVMGVVFALAMGVLGGLLPAVRAALRPVAVALREL